jgi:hypothetical protein
LVCENYITPRKASAFIVSYNAGGGEQNATGYLGATQLRHGPSAMLRIENGFFSRNAVATGLPSVI